MMDDNNVSNTAKRGALARGISPELQEEILAYLLFDNEMYDATKM